jgi:hypothetical protein
MVNDYFVQYKVLNYAIEVFMRSSTHERINHRSKITAREICGQSHRHASHNVVHEPSCPESPTAAHCWRFHSSSPMQYS